MTCVVWKMFEIIRRQVNVGTNDENSFKGLKKLWFDRLCNFDKKLQIFLWIFHVWVV